jgi:hypothetical protein
MFFLYLKSKFNSIKLEGFMRIILFMLAAAGLLLGCNNMQAEGKKVKEGAVNSEQKLQGELKKTGRELETEGRKITTEIYNAMNDAEKKKNAAKILADAGKWKTTEVRDENGNDVTRENEMYVGLAVYSGDRYEFFNLDGVPKNDRGYFFITDDMKRILVSETQNYTRIVDITELTPTLFVYRVTNPQGMVVYVSHEPDQSQQR